ARLPPPRLLDLGLTELVQGTQVGLQLGDEHRAGLRRRRLAQILQPLAQLARLHCSVLRRSMARRNALVARCRVTASTALVHPMAAAASSASSPARCRSEMTS